MEELDLLQEAPFEEERIWYDAFDKAINRGLTEEQAIKYATDKLDAYLATGIIY